MLCAKCGFELLEGSGFCSHCGEPVGVAPVEKSDAELEQLAALGDGEAFGILYQRHSDSLHDHIARLLGDPDEAQDVVHDAFERALRALKPGKKEAGFRTWLVVIANRLALKRIQKRKRIVRPTPEDDEGEPHIFDRVDPDRLGQPEAAAQDREMASLVWEGAMGLSPRNRSALLLLVREDMTTPEIAQALEISKGHASTMVSQAKRQLEESVASLLMLRVGRRDCTELDYQLRQLSMTELSPAARRLIQDHVKECPTCRERQRKLVSPVNILGAFAAVPLPLLVKQRIGESLAASAAHAAAQAGAHAAGAGLKGLLSQSAAKVSGLSAAWKAAIVTGVVVVATGGGLGTYVAVSGGLPGSGGESSGNGIPAMTTPGAASSAVPVAPTRQAAGGTGKIVFRSNRDGSQPPASGMYMMDAGGGGVTRIGTQSGWSSYFSQSDLSSQSSPDGSKVAFQKCPNSASEGLWGAFYIMNADGSGLTTVATNTVRCFTEGTGGGISWSPDGGRVVFFSGSDPSGIYVADANGGNVTYLAEGIYPQWSPLGDSIAYADKPDPEGWQCEIHRINPDGTNSRLLAQVPCEGEATFGTLLGPWPQWSSDGSMLAFSANPKQPQDMQERLNRDVFVLGADGTDLTNLTNSPSDDFDPVWVNCSLPTAGCEAKVTNVQPEFLNVREGPKTEQNDPPVVAELNEGDVVCLVGASELDGGYKWWPVSAADGTEGWAAAFDPKDPTKPWLTPTGSPCGGEPEQSAAPVSGAERIVCNNPQPLDVSANDAEGDAAPGFADIVQARVEAMGDAVVAEIHLKELPAELTFNEVEQDDMEYAWEIFFDVDGNQNTGCQSDDMKGAEFSLSLAHIADFQYEQLLTGPLLDNTQADVWMWYDTEEGCHWHTDWGDDPEASSATAALNGDRLVLRGAIPGLGPNTRWCAHTYYEDSDGSVTNDVAPE